MLSLVLQAVADEQPVVIFVDDAQWLDRESLLALGAAARDLARSPLLVLCTATPHPPRVELDELRARIGRDLKGDRKSTRLHSSHTVISYAVFFLKNKKNM